MQIWTFKVKKSRGKKLGVRSYFFPHKSKHYYYYFFNLFTTTLSTVLIRKLRTIWLYYFTYYLYKSMTLIMQLILKNMPINKRTWKYAIICKRKFWIRIRIGKIEIRSWFSDFSVKTRKHANARTSGPPDFAGPNLTQPDRVVARRPTIKRVTDG